MKFFTLTVDTELNNEIELRILFPRDAVTLYGIIDRNRDHLSPWLEWPKTQTLQTTHDHITRGLEKLAHNDGMHMGIWFRGELVGSVSFHYWNFLDLRTEIGYWMDSAAQGNGIMTRAVAALLNFAFGDLGLHRMVIRCVLENVRSRAIPERLGFTQDGIMRHEIYHNGKFQDMVIYGMLADDWQARRK